MANARPLAWDDFRLIKAIAEARALPAAAALVGINHSTVFRRLGQIEEALGIKLFERHRSGYVATPAGEEMIQLAERVDDDITAFSRRLAGQEIKPAGELRVTTNDTLLVDLLTPLFAAFLRQCPDIRLEILISNQALNLSKRDADVAIRATNSPPETLVGRRASHLVGTIYGRAADFAGAGPFDLSALAARDWVALGEQFSDMRVMRNLRQSVASERIVYRVNTMLGLAEAIEAGIGIGFLPAFVADTRPGLVRLVEPDHSFRADLWLLTHPDMRHTPRVRLFLDFMAVEIAKLRPLLEGERPIGTRQSREVGLGEPAP